jgi:hypothetical protein
MIDKSAIVVQTIAATFMLAIVFYHALSDRPKNISRILVIIVSYLYGISLMLAVIVILYSAIK